MENSENFTRASLALRALVARSPIKHEIVSLLVLGHTRKSMAFKTSRSLHTISDHIKAIYSATGARDKAHLAAIAVAAGIARPPSPPRKWGAADPTIMVYHRVEADRRFTQSTVRILLPSAINTSV